VLDMEKKIRPKRKSAEPKGGTQESGPAITKKKKKNKKEKVGSRIREQPMLGRPSRGGKLAMSTLREVTKISRGGKKIRNKKIQRKMGKEEPRPRRPRRGAISKLFVKKGLRKNQSRGVEKGEGNL